MTKRRYNMIGELLSEYMPTDSALEVHHRIAELMRYDPEGKTYKPEAGRRQIEARRRQAAAQGVSQYELKNGHKYYELNKQRHIVASHVDVGAPSGSATTPQP
jgi:hypothetical protein